jgi:hypothetical protein
MKSKKTVIAILVICSLILAACDGGNNPVVQSEVQDSQRVQSQQQIYQSVQPVPVFDYSQDRDVLIQIYRAKNETVITHTIVTAYGTGGLIFQCPSIGYAIPADTSLTNPVQMQTQTRRGDGIAAVTIEQAEPNGLFSSDNTDGTYILCVMDNGAISPVYTEMKVTTFPFPVSVDSNGVISPLTTGSPSITVDLGNTDMMPESTQETP